MQEVKAAPYPVILFIDEAHTLIGTGNQQGGLDLSTCSSPPLARGELRTITATTWREYKQYVEKDAALSRRFELVKVGEPSAHEATTILRGLRPLYEQAHGVLIADEALQRPPTSQLAIYRGVSCQIRPSICSILPPHRWRSTRVHHRG